MPKKEYPYQSVLLKDMRGEEWKDIPGLDRYYCISNFGRVKRQAFYLQIKNGTVRYMRSKIMKPELSLIKNNSVNDNVFFLRTRITQSGIQHHISIARLVYYCFIKKFDLSDNHLVVLPKDCDGRNIRPKNLALVNINRKQQRIFERGRLKRTFYHTYDEFVQEGVEKSINPYCKQVSQYTFAGKKIKTFPSIKAAAITLGISATGINSVLKERQVSSGGYVWRYGKLNFVDMKGFREKKKIEFKKKRGQKVTQYDLKGKRVALYHAIADAGRENGIVTGDICNVLAGKQRTAGGFIWKKGWRKTRIDVRGFMYGAAWRAQKRQKKVNQYTLEGKFLKRFGSLKEAAAVVKVNPTAISHACGDTQKICKGFKWRFV